MDPRTYVLRVKLSDEERRRLEATAAAKGWTVSQLIRELIRQLSN
jgi:predicted DNA-binding protein